MAKTDELRALFNPEELRAELKAAADVWKAQNADSLKNLPADAVKAAAALAVIEVLGGKQADPSLNIKKMQASAKILEVAADQQEAINKAKESAKKILGDVAKAFMARAAKAALAVFVAAV